jgi:glucose-6-phosphate 1-epimerase
MDAMNAAQLNERFGIAGALSFKDTPRGQDTPGGLVRAAISTALAEADIYLQGAQVAHWTPAGQRPVLFTSSRSLFVPGKAIRGGVPVIFPWFGPRGEGKPGPQHGFARTAPWSVEAARILDSGGVSLTFALLPTDATRALGFDAFRVFFRVEAGSALKMELEVYNDSAAPLHFEEALHSYLAIGDVGQASITGLGGAWYIDKTDGARRKQQEADAIRFVKETDSVYGDSTATCAVEDPVWKRRIVIGKSGSKSTVVWNPWIEKTAAMSDMAPDEWRNMVCVETANAGDNAVTVPPCERHRLTATIRVG